MLHGHSKKSGNTRTYRIWSNMKTRCLNPRASNYAFYGARGVSVCERWMEFANFLADMGDCPPSMTLERIDGGAGYAPDNCRWASHTEQCRNRRNNRIVTYRGEARCVAEWADRCGVPIKIICQRLARGWTAERALETR